MSREVKIIDFYYQGKVGRMYNLSSNETIVYSALCCLCANGAQEYNCTKLADLIYGVGRMTFQRCCEVLHEKGLIVIQDKKVSVNKPTAQIEQSTAQIEQSTAQIEQFAAQDEQFTAQIEQFSEKESTKEKEINKENNFFFKKEDEKKKKVVLEKEFIPPSWEEVNTFALNSNIPIDLAKQWFHRWEVCHWQQDTYIPREWQMSLTGYFENAKKNPSLTLSSRQGGGEKPMTQQEKDREKLATDHKKEKALEAIADADYDAHETEYVAYGDSSYERIRRNIMDHMAQNPKK